MQLVFVLSDARILQDRELVQKWVRRAMSKGQMLVRHQYSLFLSFFPLVLTPSPKPLFRS